MFILLFQEGDTEKIFYGIDDVEGQSDIIIVNIQCLESRVDVE